MVPIWRGERTARRGERSQGRGDLYPGARNPSVLEQRCDFRVGQPGSPSSQQPPLTRERWRRLLCILRPGLCPFSWSRAPSEGGCALSSGSGCRQTARRGRAVGRRLAGGKIPGLAGSSCCSSFCCSRTNPQLGGLNGSRHLLGSSVRPVGKVFGGGSSVLRASARGPLLGAGGPSAKSWLPQA